MIQEREILEEIQKLRKKTELLANPLYNDAGGSTFWKDIDDKLEYIQFTLEEDKRHYNW